MTDASDAPLFEAVIVPHRSLSRRGLNLLLIGIGAICAINAVICLSLGAWPVAGFTGLELVLAATLFRMHALSARASEMLMLSPSGLRIVRIPARGKGTERVLPPAWLQVVLQERPGRVPALLLMTHGVTEEVGAALGDAEKRDLARALQEALHRWRNPRFDNPQLQEE